ncbi:MAG: 4-carboxymuconolactone decarboxylase domain/alkylhydroperoxidase AhpD family core domain protein, partial [uncultured Thermomicrobiales bacterium]
ARADGTAAAGRPGQRGAGDAGDARPGRLPGAPRPGAHVARSGEAPGVPDQRLRLLPGHAHQRRPGARGERAADLPARRLAREPVLQRARTGGSGLDGGGDPGGRDPRPGRGLRGGPAAVRRRRAAGADDGRGHDQRLQPPERDPADGARRLPTGPLRRGGGPRGGAGRRRL